MKKLFEKINSAKMAKYLATFAMIFTITGANSHCHYIFHDVEKPDLTQFRKF